MEKSVYHISKFIDYQDLIKSPCVIKFTASWCGPCKRVAPIFVGLVEKYHTTVKFLEVDIDISDEIVNYENIQAVPSFRFYFNGKSFPDFSVNGANGSALIQNVQKFVDFVEKFTPSVVEEKLTQALDVKILSLSNNNEVKEEVKLVEKVTSEHNEEKSKEKNDDFIEKTVPIDVLIEN